MSFELGVLHRRHPHLFADLAELVLVTCYDGLEELSQASLESISKELPRAAEELEAAEHDGEGHPIDQIETSDRYVEDCWAQLEYRASVFGDYYPFVVDGVRLCWKSGRRTPKHCLYVFLLVCSRLRSFDVTGFSQWAAKVFTMLSKNALMALVGPSSVVRIFDANSSDRQIYYGTDLRDAMVKLAEDLGAHAIHHDEIRRLSPSGDRGLDLVAIDQIEDSAKGVYAVFGQCGAQEREWPNKTLEAHPIRFTGLFSCLSEPASLMFIPVSYRDSNGDWVAAHVLSGCTLIDRLRIVRLLNRKWAANSIVVRQNCYAVLQKVVASGAAH